MLSTRECLPEYNDGSGGKCDSVDIIVSLQYTWELVVLTGL